MAEHKHNPCRCIGRPNRFERGHCFTCGRMLGQFIGQLETDPRANGTSAALGVLLHAVGRKRDEMHLEQLKRAHAERLPLPRPAHVRRVVIEPPPPPAGSAKQKKRRKAATVDRGREVRELEHMTRAF